MPDPAKLQPENDPVNAVCNLIRGAELFEVRLAMESRLHEYQKHIRDNVKKGKQRTAAVNEARRLFGYQGIPGERQLYYKYLKSRSKQLKRESAADDVRMKRQYKRNLPFELAFADLPERANVEQEIDWVRNHPAMARKARLTEALAKTPLLITVDDLTEVSHGTCPSRCAANMLQNWVNDPEKFFAGILAEQKKGLKGARSGESDSEAEPDVATADIDALMESLLGGNK